MQTHLEPKEHFFSPYQYASEMIEEQVEDSIFREIKDLCLIYINVGAEKFKEDYNRDEVMVSYEFVTKKIKDLNKIKQVFELNTSDTPFIHIGHAMDLVTVSDTIKGFTNRSIYYELSTQINLTLEMLTMCFAALERMILIYEGETHDN